MTHPAIVANPALAEFPKKFWTNAERSYTEQCEHPPREAGEPRLYTHWHAWAEQKSKTHHQRKCPHCGLFVIWEPKR